eukprot:TRINITY_DN15948_c0_g2_i1.p1 TRINITY_DN15948_c0_g2~~TRINITY_DN15948_c0_g2_i1.p1  ORF type:complete len:232 (-),score=9.06 TRINITY_DN15948_c0_g2_i1:565-1197(-)
MWVRTCALYSIYIDLMFLACVVCNFVVSEWLFYVRCGVKVVLIVGLMWRCSTRNLEAWVVAIFLVAVVLFVSTACKVLSDFLWTAPAMKEMTNLWVNRIVETPVTLICCAKFFGNDTSQQVVPLQIFDTSKFVYRTCTWVELCGSCDDAPDIDSLSTCCICLESIELHDMVTQLICKHFYHTDCAAQWMRRCTTGRLGGSLCPMRCPSVE